ncbi:TPA: hypothetical protein P0E36_004929 [Vibrio harveyi]|nr:hypothetical protein [Vibrio harveyi]
MKENSEEHKELSIEHDRLEREIDALKQSKAQLVGIFMTVKERIDKWLLKISFHQGKIPENLSSIPMWIDIFSKYDDDTCFLEVAESHSIAIDNEIEEKKRRVSQIIDIMLSNDLLPIISYEDSQSIAINKALKHSSFYLEGSFCR